MTDFAPRFDPKEAEPRLYKLWEERELFKAHARSEKPPFTIVIPPPNVTGSLHMGHALNNTIQDLLIRWKRMQGFECLYLPGTDHAGIATQNVVEKELKKEGTNRHVLGRDSFLRRVWAWKEQYGETIYMQLRRLGCSCDWSRERFTMDESYVRAIRTVFVHLFDKKLIYRGKRPINWCPRCMTALSDLEVRRPEGVQMGKLWHIRYPISGEAGRHIVVATTRPETMLGDTAVMVHPKDPRYAGLVGKKAVFPFVNREIPIIADEAVDMKFGSGAVKVTPAHDMNDWEVSKRHDLPAVVVMDETAKMNDQAGPFAGLDRFEARKQVLERLKEMGLLEKEEEHATPVGHCERCDTIVEPYLSEQWFVDMKPLAAPAIEAVKSGRVQFHPDRWARIYLDWMENIQDWCVSRQIWWGHRIPVWTCSSGHVAASVDTPTACETCGSGELRQDADVL
ncbi:MAG TPA: valine--tRNA ligase, partial [Planctomycetota bacterium]|nr:valine--tRNA ligase [Planctomycetota bacterium]